MRRARVLLALLVAPSSLLAQRSLAIKNFEASIVVGADGTVDVSERITAQFTGAWNGLYRSVPVEYRTPQGFNWTLRLDAERATDGEGHALRMDHSREGHYLKYRIWVPGALNATRTVVFHYRASNGLRFFADHDELYWNITGDEWDVPIEAATARIELPGAATGIRSIAFNGVYGSTARDAQVVSEGNVVRITMPKALGFHEGVTAVVGWNKGVVAEPTQTDKVLGFFASNWPLAIPAPVFIILFLVWRKVGRDPSELPVTVQYEPPDGLTPAEAGTLTDEAVDMRDITATMVDLAVNGWLKIEEREEKALFGLIKSKQYVFHRLEPGEGARKLEPHEQSVLLGIFATGAEVPLSELEREFYAYLPGIRTGVYQRLMDRGLYRSRPDQVKNRWMAAGVVLAALICVAAGPASARLALSPVAFVVAAVLSGLIVALFGRVMPARTIAGARTLERVRGFEEFLRRVESDRFERVVKTPEMFERFLPYAMTFGVAQKWAHAFQDIYREPPRWYVGADPMGFNAVTFSSRLSDLSTRAGSTMSSSPRGSGGSGFSGGSSGGGSGGGGGGGF